MKPSIFETNKIHVNLDGVDMKDGKYTKITLTLDSFWLEFDRSGTKTEGDNFIQTPYDFQSLEFMDEDMFCMIKFQNRGFGITFFNEEEYLKFQKFMDPEEEKIENPICVIC